MKKHTEAVYRFFIVVVRLMAFLCVIVVSASYFYFGTYQNIKTITLEKIKSVDSVMMTIEKSNTVNITATASVGTGTTTTSSNVRTVNATNIQTTADTPDTDKGTETNTNTIDLPKRRIFSCGWPFGQLRQHLFPDYEYVGQYHPTNQSSLTDLLYFGMHGPCPSNIQHVVTKFGGKVLFLDGEPYGNIIDYFQTKGKPVDAAVVGSRLAKSRVYQVAGPAAPWKKLSQGKDHYLPGIYHVAMLSVGLFGPKFWATIADRNQRPKSTWWWKRMNATTSTAANANLQDDHPPPEPPTKLSTHDPQVSNVIFVSRHSVPVRIQAANSISSIMTMDVAGGVRVNGKYTRYIDLKKQFPVLNTDRADHSQNSKFYRYYKFCLVMENSNVPGYISEKLLWALMGGCLPIYWGSRQDVNKVFNPGAYFFWDTNDVRGSLERLRNLDANETAYMEIMAAPIFRHYGEGPNHDGSSLQQYFSLSDDVGSGYLKKKIRTWLEIPIP